MSQLQKGILIMVIILGIMIGIGFLLLERGDVEKNWYSVQIFHSGETGNSGELIEKYATLESLPRTYSEIEAINDGCFVVSFQSLYHLETLEQFLQHVKEQVPDQLRIVNMTTEGDLIIDDLTFQADGSLRWTSDSTRDTYGSAWSQEIHSVTYPRGKFELVKEEVAGEEYGSQYVMLNLVDCTEQNGGASGETATKTIVTYEKSLEERKSAVGLVKSMAQDTVIIEPNQSQLFPDRYIEIKVDPKQVNRLQIGQMVEVLYCTVEGSVTYETSGENQRELKEKLGSKGMDADILNKIYGEGGITVTRLGEDSLCRNAYEWSYLYGKVTGEVEKNLLSVETERGRKWTFNLHSAVAVETDSENFYSSGDWIKISFLEDGIMSEEEELLPRPRRIERASEESPVLGEDSKIRVNGKIYRYVGPSDITARCGNMDGVLRFAIEKGEEFTCDDQSNFGAGYEYQFFDGIDVWIHDTFIHFALES